MRIESFIDKFDSDRLKLEKIFTLSEEEFKNFYYKTLAIGVIIDAPTRKKVIKSHYVDLLVLLGKIIDEIVKIKKEINIEDNSKWAS